MPGICCNPHVPLTSHSALPCTPLQELCLLLPGVTEEGLMTAPTLDSYALLDLCLDTAKVAARLVSGMIAE